MASFGTKAISYQEQGDNGFIWNVRYDLSFENSESLTTLKIDLVGADPGALAAQWKAGINDIWNDKAFFSDGGRLYEVKLKADFVDAGAHHTVTVHPGSGAKATNMTNWYLSDPGGWPNHMHDEVAAHEVGHMFGNFDEYAEGATNGGYTTTGTFMSDMTLSGFEDYFWTQEYYTELHGGFSSLSTVRANTGTAGDDAMTGGGGMDGFCGMAGRDTINGGGGNDLIDGGRGQDSMTGGAGSDIFDFDAPGECSLPGTYGYLFRDLITDFTAGVDDIDVSGMDASSVLAGDNAFTWRGTGTFGTGAEGELRYVKFDRAGTANDYTAVFGDTDSDAAVEFQIELRGLVTLGSSDFHL